MSDVELTLFGDQGFAADVNGSLITITAGTTISTESVEERVHELAIIEPAKSLSISIAPADTGIRYVCFQPSHYCRLAYTASTAAGVGNEVPAGGKYFSAITNSTVLWILNKSGTTATVEVQVWVV